MKSICPPWLSFSWYIFTEAKVYPPPPLLRYCYQRCKLVNHIFENEFRLILSFNLMIISTSTCEIMIITYWYNALLIQCRLFLSYWTPIPYLRIHIGHYSFENCIPLTFLLTAVSDIQLLLLCKILAGEAHDESSHGTNCNWHRTDDAPQIHSMLSRYPKDVWN